MKRRTRKIKLYTVVEVWRGLAASAKSFMTLQDALNHRKHLCRGRNMMEDDVQLFEGSVRI